MRFTEKIFIHSDNQVPTYNKRLSICLQSKGFSFAVKGKEEKLYTFGDIECSFPDHLSEVINLFKQIFSTLQVPVSGYQQVELVLPTAKHTWIPEHLFSEGKEKEYLQAITTIKSTESCLSNFVDEVRAFSVYAVPNVLISGLKIAIPSVKMMSQFSKMLSLPCVKHNKSGFNLTLSIRETEIDIILFDAEKFLLSNTFIYSTQDDIVYYVLNIVKQLKLAENRLTLHLLGEVYPETFERFRQFFPYVHLERLDQLVLTSEEFGSLPRHRFALVLSNVS